VEDTRNDFHHLIKRSRIHKDQLHFESNINHTTKKVTYGPILRNNNKQTFKSSCLETSENTKRDPNEDPHKYNRSVQALVYQK
jgi:hypothetical protein